MEKSILRLRIRSEADVAAAHSRASQISELAGIEGNSGQNFALAVSDVCRNVLKYLGEADAEFLVAEIPDSRYLEAVISNNPKKNVKSGTAANRSVTGGLAVVHDNVNLHSSKVWLRTEIPEKGSVMTPPVIKEWRKKLSLQNKSVPSGKEKFHCKIVQQLDYLRLINSAVVNNLDQNHHYINTVQKTHEKIMSLLDKHEQSYKELKMVNNHLETYACSVSHDLKAPLRNLEGLINALRESLEENDKPDAIKIAGMLKGQIKRMDKFIAGVLSVARTNTPGKFQKVVKPAALISQVLQNLAVPDGFKVNMQPRMHEVYASPVKLGQVFGNLITNAFKHHDSTQGNVAISGKFNKRKGFITFKVSDDGPGIPASKRDKIFGAYKNTGHTLKPGSSGMGLFMIKQIVEEAGGTIWVESEGRGCSFYFTWPAGLSDPDFIS